MKDVTPSTMDGVFTLLWVIVIPLVALTMLLGKFLTFLLLAVGVYSYINNKVGFKNFVRRYIPVK